MEQISKALKEFQSDPPEVNMDAEVTVQTRSGGTYKFKYATLSNIIKKVLPKLNSCGLSFSQTFDDSCVVTTLHHESGEYITSKVPCDFSNGTMQEIGSRISYLKRYGLSAMLGVVGEEDDDANIADGNAYQKKRVGGSALQRHSTPIENKQKPTGTGNAQMNEKQLKYIKGCGEKLGLTKDETWEFMKWIAEQNNIDPKHWKMAKLILPENNFNTEYAKYTQREISE